MLIDDEVALRDWLVATLEPLCDAEPIALARYVLALITKDKPLDKLRENCIDRLEVFLDRATKDFVDQLFEVIGNGRYIPEAKKENVQPKASETNDDKSGDSSENLEPQTSTSPTRQENEQEQIPSTSQTTASSDYSSTAASSSQQQSSGAVIQSVKRRYPYRSSSGRHHSPNPPRRHVNNSSGGANRHQQSSHYRSTTNSSNQRSHRSSSRSRSGSPPPAKRSQRSYSHSSSGSSSRSSPSRQTTTSNTTHQQPISNTNFLYKKLPCTSYFENKGYCAQGDACPYDHGTNNVPFDQQQHQQQQQQQAYYPSYQQYGIPPGHLHPHYHEYNPEAPDLKHAPHQGPPMFMRHPMHHHPRMPGPPLAPGQMPPSQQQMMMMNPQRTLVTVVTNAEPLPLEQKLRQNDSMSVPNSSMPPIMHTKRHITTGPYSNERRPHHHHHQQQQQQQHDHSTNNESNNQSNSNNTSNNNNNNNPPNTNNGYNNRGWKRPWQKPDASGSAPATLEIRKIPVEFNTISKLNEHFSKFGTVTNVQIAYDGAADSALVAYATLHEAETAYKNPEPLFNNRFIKIFWHNNNKNQSSGNNNNNNNNNSNQNNQQQSSSSSDGAPTKKSSASAPNPMKHHWMKMQQMSGNKSEQSTAQPAAPAPTVAPTASTAVPTPPAAAAATTTTTKKPVASVPTVSKKDAAKKAVLEIHRKKQGLLEEQIQQQKLLLKKLETAETNAEKESIRSLMKQVDATIVTLKDSLRITPPAKSSTTTTTTTAAAPVAKLSQQDLLKKRAQTLQKQLETLRAKTSADMRRAMSSTLSQTPLNLPNISQENDSKTSSANENPAQITIKNINNLPRNELDEFLKNSGATNIQSGDSDNSLIVIFPSKSHVNQIQKNGLTFQNEKLDLSFADDSLLNTSQKKRTLSETLEDELLGVTSTDTANDDDDEPNAKRRNQSQTSDVEENDDDDDDDDQLLDNNETKQVNLSLSTHDDFEPQDLDDEIQLLDS